MEHIEELVRGRRSVRAFDGRDVSAQDVENLRSFMAEIENPYGIPVELALLDGQEHGLSSPVVSGASLYVGGKLQSGPHANAAFGYSFEMLVLYAQSLGIGTVWIGGTMDRALFERAMKLGEGEIMPCVSPLGYPAAKMSLKESMMRKAVKADTRLPFETLFLDGASGAPLTEEAAGRLAWPLEMVRWAPSAVNKQPWRAAVSKDAVHFYLKRSKGFPGGTVDMQMIDMGIALCHFALAAAEKGLEPSFAIDDPGITTEAGMEYIASYTLPQR